MTGAGRRRPVSKLSLLAGLTESFSSVPATADSFSRSPTARSFGYEGAVGLGIVAAMSDGGQDHSHGGAAAIAMTPRSALPRRSEPIPIFSARSGAIGIPRRDQRIEEEEDEQEREMMSESYTCVISHVEGSTVRKRVYLDDGGGDLWGCCPGVFFDSPPAALPPAAEDFLSRCFRCRRALHGIDIFIYRGDKAFCSAECRSRQIASEEQGRSKYPLDAPTALDCSPSPCSAPLLFPAGVAAA